MPLTPGLWRHQTKQTTLPSALTTLTSNTSAANHLINAVKTNCGLAIHWTRDLYCGLSLNWHYDKGYLNVSMPGYVKRALKTFEHPAPVKLRCALHKWIEPAYGSQTPQSPTTTSKGQPLDKDSTTQIQSIDGTFMYFGRACDPCILPALNKISTKQAAPTTKTIKRSNMLMDYLHTYPDGKIRY
jgi:hypothetical protein